jgi:hypothetical protein
VPVDLSAGRALGCTGKLSFHTVFTALDFLVGMDSTISDHKFISFLVLRALRSKLVFDPFTFAAAQRPAT